MYLTRLSLTDFRGFSRLDLNVPREIFLLVGGNAQGKTTLLEAIYFLSTFSSFHASSDRQLINFTQPLNQLTVSRIIGEFTRRDGDHRIEVRLILEPSSDNGGTRFRKEVLLDGVKRKICDVVGWFNAVIFLPQMARIIEEGPSERRRHLDLLISQVSPPLCPALKRLCPDPVTAQRIAKAAVRTRWRSRTAGGLGWHAGPAWRFHHVGSHPDDPRDGRSGYADTLRPDKRPGSAAPGLPASI